MQLTGTTLHYANDGTYNISCYGGHDGSIGLTITGGSGIYTYSWTGPNSFSSGSKDISGLSAGNYRCTVTDLNGCILTPSPEYNLTEPPPLSITSVLSTSTDGAYNINCFGGTGSADITVSGGIPGTYQYFWSTDNGTGITDGQEDQPALTAGTYHLKVRDINNCESSLDFVLVQPAKLGLNFTVTNITCQSSGFDNGAIDLTSSGGVAPYTYLWSNGLLTQDISGLTQGSYQVVVTDSNGCTERDSARVNLPPPLTYSKILSDYNGYNITCNGLTNGFIKINPTSGEPPFIYSWTGQDGFTSSAKDVSGLKAGSYTLTITDRNFCTSTETFDMKEPGKLGMTVSVSESIAGGYNINCAGAMTGSINVEALNYAGTAEYLWSDGINGKARSGLTAGDYGLIITDGNNCHADTLFTLTQPDSIKLSYLIRQPFCTDKPEGSIVLTVTGGVPDAGYFYLWSDNSTLDSLTNIPAGVYNVTVTDLNGCSVKESMRVDPLHDICLSIPNAISPNGDLINDVWNIGMIELYPRAEVVIFNRWGETVWRSENGYPQPWDGRSEGRDLPVDSYHYIINLHNGSRIIIGNVTIVR